MRLVWQLTNDLLLPTVIEIVELDCLNYLLLHYDAKGIAGVAEERYCGQPEALQPARSPVELSPACVDKITDTTSFSKGCA